MLQTSDFYVLEAKKWSKMCFQYFFACAEILKNSEQELWC